jgi:hypothetical protein
MHFLLKLAATGLLSTKRNTLPLELPSVKRQNLEMYSGESERESIHREKSGQQSHQNIGQFARVWRECSFELKENTSEQLFFEQTSLLRMYSSKKNFHNECLSTT